MSELFPTGSEAIEVSDPFDHIALAAAMKVQRLRRIGNFTGRNGLQVKTHEAHNRRLALLDMPDMENIDPTTLSKYLAQRVLAERTDIFNNCFQVAQEAYASGAATGVLHGEGTHQLVGWDNHRINYDLLSDGTTVAADYTSRENILGKQDARFDVLALRAGSVPDLIAQTAELYGGNWREVKP